MDLGIEIRAGAGDDKRPHEIPTFPSPNINYRHPPPQFLFPNQHRFINPTHNPRSRTPRPDFNPKGQRGGFRPRRGSFHNFNSEGNRHPTPNLNGASGDQGYQHRNSYQPHSNRYPNSQQKGPSQFYQPRFNSPNPSPRFSHSQGRGGCGTYFTNNDSFKGGKYFCDTCDKGFPDQEKFDEHKAEHIICKLDGCQFTACSKIVLKHIKMQHSTNLFTKIQGLDTPESIEKWRQERKLNFPSKSNIETKAAKKQALRNRGERISGIATAKEFNYGLQRLKPLRYPIESGNNNNRNRRGGRNRNQNPRPCFIGEIEMTKCPKFIIEKNTSEILILDKYYSEVRVSDKGKLVGKSLKIWKKDNLTKDADIDSNSDSENEEMKPELLNGITNNITDDEVEEQSANTVEIEPNLVEKAEAAPVGGSLVTYYSSDSDGELEDGEVPVDDDSSELPESAPISRIPPEIPGIHKATLPISSCYDSQTLPEVKSKRVKNLLESGGKKPKNKAINGNPNSQKFKTDNSNTVGQKKNFRKVQCPQPRPRPPTLLRRLLDDEICKERNYVLQACRFIVENNFFESKIPNDQAEPKTSEGQTGQRP